MNHHLAFILTALFLAGSAYSHPGGRDAEGCHICKTNCEKWGVKPGVRHCTLHEVYGPCGDRVPFVIELFFGALGHGPDGKIYYPGDKKPKPRYEFPTDVTIEGADKAYVEKVSDGDTIKVRLLPSGEKMTVRLLGIDCPESHVNAKCKRGPKEGRHDCAWQVPRGLKASKRAAELMKHKTVYLECAGKCTKGRYGRALRYVRLDSGQDFSLIMVKEGYCEDFGWKYPHPRGDEYKKAQVDARLSGKRIWAGEELPPIIVGKGLAESLRVKKGDVVWMVRPPTEEGAQLIPEAWFRVVGIFETGKLELDTKRVCSTPKGLKPLVRDIKIATLESIVASQHNIAGVQVLAVEEGAATADDCKKAAVTDRK